MALNRVIRPAVIERLSTPLFIGLSGAVIFLVLFAALAEEMLEGHTRKFDDAVRLVVHAHSHTDLTAVMRFLSIVGSPTVVTIIAIASCIALWLVGHPRRAILIAVTVVGGSLLMWVLKLAFHRHRPDPFFNSKVPLSYRFPSGHAMLSFCLCLTAAALFSSRRKNLVVRITIWTFWVGLSGAIGYSRIYLGVHYPSDVLAGYLAALVWSLAIGGVYQKWRKLPSPVTPTGSK
jgi:undecaprenyl-diphosphatase